MPKKIDYIYENDSDGFWFRLKQSWNQIFRRKSANNNFKSSIEQELEYIDDDVFENESFSNNYKKVFGVYLSDNQKAQDYDVDAKDISEIANLLKPNKSNDKKKDSFENLIANPLEKLSSMDIESEEYKKAVKDLSLNAEMYINSHNPYSKEGKQRLEFVVRLKFMMSQIKDFHEEMDENETELYDNVELENIKEDTKLEQQAVVNIEKIVEEVKQEVVNDKQEVVNEPVKK